jgi:Carboxypeptidase regulatory-like domain
LKTHPPAALEYRKIILILRLYLAVFVVLALEPLLSAQTKQQCTLAGTVVNSATNTGIAHALVSVNGATNGFRFTDVAGNFEFQGLPCGPHTVSGAKPGFVSEQTLSQRSTPGFFTSPSAEEPEDPAGRAPAPAFQQVTLTPDAAAVRVVLIPVSSIVGTVLDENAEPLAGVSVQAIAVKASLSGTDYVAAQSVNTDDRGRYSLLSLDPGEYLVRLAGESASTHYFTGTLNLTNDHRGMQPVYFPNADTLSSANVLSLAPGSQTTADFRTSTEPAFDLSGRITGLIPQAWTRLRLYRDGDRLPVGRAYVNLTTGQFRLADVPRGHYTLRVLHYRADPPAYFAAEQPVAVNTEPVRDVNIQLSPVVEIPVKVSYEAGASEGQVQLQLHPQHSPENVRFLMAGQPPKRASSAGLDRGLGAAVDEQTPRPAVFSDVIPDRYKLVASAFGAAYVASARMGDVDALHGEFQINGPSQLQVIVRGDSATVQGQVTFQGKPAPGAIVYLIPSGDGAELKLGFADQQGHYTISGVAPGDYRVRAWSAMPLPKELTSSGGETLSVQTSEQRTVDLEAVPTENR